MKTLFCITVLCILSVLYTLTYVHNNNALVLILCSSVGSTEKPRDRIGGFPPDVPLLLEGGQYTPEQEEIPPNALRRNPRGGRREV